ncbi:hypothetical protein EDD17DRAFT_1762505 [Pisolithus thermaeus]|nr:hypothetical protein EV401DRAFT_2096938 [Pisolithus croceorrhizus]KAI6159458.1 hypothetical protein EDD17DRAFT_1762505 [Pisolithus thermaeus]
MSSHCFSQLVQTLCHANRRYTHVALLHRSTLHLTHHAKRTASHLRIDTRKARRCPIHFVARQPLPLLELSPLVPVRTSPVAMQGSTQAMDAGVDAMLSTALRGLHYSYPDLLMYSDVPTPGAPLLRPRQLPEVDVLELPFDPQISSPGKSLSYALVSTLTTSSHRSLAGLSSCELLTPPEAYTALRIIIPARNDKKRKWKDAQIELDGEDTHRAKRIVLNTWITSPIRTDEYIHA